MKLGIGTPLRRMASAAGICIALTAKLAWGEYSEPTPKPGATTRKEVTQQKQPGVTVTADVVPKKIELQDAAEFSLFSSSDAHAATKVARSEKTFEHELAGLKAALKNQDAASIFGTWSIAGTDRAGKLITAELQLDASGGAKLAIPDADGKPVTTKHQLAIEKQSLKLIGAHKDVLIGKVVEVNERQMVIDGKDGPMTFIRR